MDAERNGWTDPTRTPRFGGWERRREGDVRGKGTVRAPAGLSGDGDGDGVDEEEMGVNEETARKDINRKKASQPCRSKI